MQLAIITKDLQFSQIAMMLTLRLNNIKNDDADIVVMYEEKSFFLTKLNFPIMPVNYLNHFNTGIVVATSMEQAEYITHIPTKAKKYYYVQDLDWLRPWGRDYYTTKRIYDNIDLICCSTDQQKEIKRFCGKEAVVVKDFNIEELIGAIS